MTGIIKGKNNRNSSDNRNNINSRSPLLRNNDPSHAGCLPSRKMRPTDGQTCMKMLIRCSSLTLEREEQLTTGRKEINLADLRFLIVDRNEC
jgi:hypothetical protein